MAAVSGAENPQVIRWLEPGFLFSQVLCRPQLKVLACCMCNKSCMEHCISLAMKQRMTAAHHQHTARLQQQDIPPLYKPSCSQSSELVYALHILGPERTSFVSTWARQCATHCMYIPYHLHVLVDGFFRSCTFHPHELEANPIG